MKLQDTLIDIAERWRTTKKAALMAHSVLGYPSLDISVDIVVAEAEGGAELLELQLPFSDPIADGSIIMEANQRALAAGATPVRCFRLIQSIAHRTSAPLLLMSYFNPLLSYAGGVRTFCRDAANAGVQGLIVPDVPPEEREDDYQLAARDFGLSIIPFVSPLTNKRRLEVIRKRADRRAFLYCISRPGTTGARSSLPPYFASYLNQVRRRFGIPLAIGFGISNRRQVRDVSQHAEVVIIGSAIIAQINKVTPQNAARRAGAFVRGLV